MTRNPPNPIDVHVGARVYLRRIERRLSQDKLATRLGITFQQVQKYEKGINRISASRLQEIARILDVPVAYFFEEGTAPQTTTASPDNAASIVAFLSSEEGLALNRAFSYISSRRQRRCIIDLVRAIADAA
jgi:transcriptional regulator with XRE-family HTH domain